MTTALMTVSGISVEFGAVKALAGVDLNIHAAQIHGVIGPNGAGKSTLIDVLSGRTRPSRGQVTFDGDDITTASIEARRSLGIGRSFQRTSIFPSLTVADQLNLVARHVGEHDVDTLIEALGLTEVLDRTSGSIAYGTQRRIDLALAVMGTPKLLLLDEPAAGLTSDETSELMVMVERFARERSVAVLLVEHDVEAVFAVAQHITVLDMGAKLAEGNPSTVRAMPEVIKAYLGSAA